MRLACAGAWAMIWALTTSCSAEPDPTTFNCARFDTKDWTAPDGCTCTGPHGETEWTRPIPVGETPTEGRGLPEPITCDDYRLQACPSSSGGGCWLVGQSQMPIDDDDPAWVEMHVDIAGHVHDMCCGAYYADPTAAGFELECNGCTGQHPDGRTQCAGQTLLGTLIGEPFDIDQPCAAEWRHAVNAFLLTEVRWSAPFDTTLRWTAPQTIARNLGTPSSFAEASSGSSSSSYVRPGGDGEGDVPLMGRALAATTSDPIERRAPPGQVLGTRALSDPYDAFTGALGLSAAQISSFCRNESALYDIDADRWRCEDDVSSYAGVPASGPPSDGSTGGLLPALP